MPVARARRSPDPRTVATRNALISAAIAALRDVGFVGATAREIADRANRPPSQVFYHFGSVPELLLAALDEVSERRLAAYGTALRDATTFEGLLAAGRRVVAEDLAAGHVVVLLELVAGSRAVPGLSDRIAERLAPWEELTREAVERVAASHPLGALLPTADVAHALVAGVLGLELLALVEGDRSRIDALADRVGAVATVLGAGHATPQAPS